MSDTPKTDEISRVRTWTTNDGSVAGDAYHSLEYVPADFARQLERDAARYRFIRNPENFAEQLVDKHGEEDLDRAIDEAIKRSDAASGREEKK